MAIREKITLVDDYSAKANKISKSTSAMGKAMVSIKGSASKMGSALKSAFNRKYEVKLEDLDIGKTKAKIKDLDSSLSKLTGKSHNLKIEAKSPAFDKFKSGISGLGSKFQSFKNPFGKIKKLSLDTRDFYKAKLEARNLSKEVSRITGKKHKISITADNPIKSMFSGIGGKIKSGFSRMMPSNLFKGFKTPMAIPARGGGGMIGSIVKGNLISSAIMKGFEGIKAGLGSIFGAGMERLENIQAAKARLTGFGHDKGTVNTISNNAMEAVKGTAYGFGDAMTASASAVAAGIKPGKELTAHLKNIGNAAAATGADFNEMGSIFNKVKTTGYLQGDEARQIMDRGIALLPALSKTMGESIDSVREKMSRGEITFDDFSKAMSSATGTVSEEMANTFSGAKANLKAALGRIGANLLGGSDNEGGMFKALTPAIKGVTKVLTMIEGPAGRLGDAFGKLIGIVSRDVANTFNRLKGWVTKAFEPLKSKFGEVITKFGEAFAPLKKALGGLFGAGENMVGSGAKVAIDLVAGALGVVADILTTYVIPAFSMVAEWVSANVIPVLQSGLEFIQSSVLPALQQLGEWIFANVLPAFQAIGEWISANVLPALQSIGESIATYVLPLLQQFGEWIQSSVLPALQSFGSFIVDSVLPALGVLGDFIINSVVPVFISIVTTILSIVIPVFTTLVDIIANVVVGAFNILKGVLDTVVGVFNTVVGAVQTAIDAFFNIPGMIADALSGIGGAISGAIGGLFGGGKGHATGTEYFGGGLTRVNERGEEMIQLARGDKIYPADKTDRIIKNEVKNSKTVDRSVSNPNITININGANMTNKDVVRAMTDEFKRLGVLV